MLSMLSGGSHMRKNKLILILLGLILCGLLIFGFVSLIQHNAARETLLQAVHLENVSGLKETGYINWTDWLKYKDGYEIMTFSVAKDQWKTPDEWMQEDTPVSLDELQNMLKVHLDPQGIDRLNVTADSCSSWYFLDHRSAETPFDQREYDLAFVAETADSLTVVIYRGHHLYGLN